MYVTWYVTYLILSSGVSGRGKLVKGFSGVFEFIYNKIQVKNEMIVASYMF